MNVMQSHYPANTVWRWCPMDTEELYLRNRREQPELLAQHGWWDYRPFDYRFNSHGFRSAEFDHRPSIMYLGCSLTMGIGVAQEQTWAYRVSERLGMGCWNLAQGGAAMDTCFRSAEHWVTRLRPERVIMLCPPERLEWVDEDGDAHTLLPSEQTGRESKGAMGEFYRRWLTHPENNRLNYLKNLWAMERLCDRQNIVMHHWRWQDMFDLRCPSLARDLWHPGAETHQLFAEKVLREI